MLIQCPIYHAGLQMLRKHVPDMLRPRFKMFSFSLGMHWSAEKKITRDEIYALHLASSN